MDKDGTRRELVKVNLTRQLIPGTRDVMRRQGFEDLCLTGKIEESFLKKLVQEEDKE